uniref:Nucleolar protein 10 n=2 Tax=Parascaris univalens TaxID=6257 RepID=A0A915AVI3_PARUN
MQVSLANDVKIYNLSAGKSIPEWISDRKRRKLEQKDIDIRRRIQLIQDFDMPDVSHTVNITPDGRYIFATGTYKPFVKCFDLNDISLKFARGLDADVIKMVILSDDYSKFILLQEDRYLEMHAAFGRYFRMRIPKFGRDMAFCHESSDLFIVGSGSEIYRLNLEQGQFLESLSTSSPSLTCCEFNEDHQLFVCGTIDGRIEAWDHRDRSRAGILDCAPHALSDDTADELPQTCAVKFKDALHLAVGTSTGKVLLYDIRSSRPLLVKDHQMGLPIRRIDFVAEHDLVLSMDSRIFKVWNELDGKPFAAIEPGTGLADFCRYPNSGLLLFANEAPKMLQYFMPAIGTAPVWCSYLETITEELEETEQPAVYDDYKFVTAQQLEDVGLSHLIGTNILRAYMHGYFIDIRLYNKAKTLTQPFAYENYKRKKLVEKMNDERINLSIIKKANEKIPKVNKELAAKLQSEMSLLEEKVDKRTKKKGKQASSVLTDQRFASLFTNPDFEVDQDSEQYKLINPAIKKIEEKRRRLIRKQRGNSVEGSDEDDEESAIQSGIFMKEAPVEGSSGSSSEDNSDEPTSDGETDDDEGETELRQQKEEEGSEEDDDEEERKAKKREVERRKAKKPKGFQLIELDVGEDASQFMSQGNNTQKDLSETLGAMRERLAESTIHTETSNVPFGGRQISFHMKAKGAAANAQRIAEKQEEHLRERRELHRGAREIVK